MSTVIAIDQSTSATKALLYDADGRCLDRESVEHEQIYPQPGWVEHDLDKIWRNVLAAVKAIVSRNRGAIESLTCVSLTNQRETVGVFERGTGKPLGNAIVWQCRRGAPVCRELEEAGHGGLVAARTGLRLDTYFSAPKLKWWLERDPGLKARVASGDALVGTIDCYLVYRLTGGEVFATDHTNASRTLLYDIRKLGWDVELCELFGVPVAGLPEVRESSAGFGETTFDGLLDMPVPVCGVMGDSQAALFAQRCYETGAAKVTFGTGSSVLLNIGGEPRRASAGAVTAVAWVLDGKPTYSFEGIINFSAASIAWLRDRLGLLGSASEAGEMAAAVSDNGGVYLVPAFAGLGAPHWKPDAKAAIVGLTAHSDRNHVVRAAEESIAYQLADVLEMMDRDGGVPVRAIRADGGPTRDQFLMQFTADTLGVELDVSSVPDCSALGAVMAGMLGRGLCGGLDDLAALPRDSSTYRPAMDPERARANREGWAEAVEMVL